MSDLRKLHPYTVFSRSFSAIRGIAVPILFVLVLTRTSDFSFLRILLTLLGIVLLWAAAAVYNLIWWRCFSYQADDSGLSLNWGILIKRHRFASLSRVQRITTQAGPFMRILGLNALRIETAGGSDEPEIYLPAVNLQEAERLQQLLNPAVGERSGEPSQDAAERASSPGPDSMDSTIGSRFTMRISDMIIAGVTSGGIFAGLIFWVAIYGELSSIIDSELQDRFYDLFPNVIVMFAAIFGGMLVISWITSSLLHIESFWGFSAVRNGKHISISRGLLTRRSTELEVSRIHTLTIVESPVRALFGRAVVKASVVGQSSNDGMDSAKLFPMIRRRELDSALASLLPEYIHSGEPQRPPASAVWLYILRAAVPVFMCIAAAAWYFSLPWLLLLTGIPAAWAVLMHRDSGSLVEQGIAVFRGRFWARRTVRILHRRVQAAELQYGPLERRMKLGTVRLSAVTGILRFTPMSGSIVRSIAAEDAETIRSWFEEASCPAM
ncbi:PH domain-containing protein [Spirochaeta dissipatitropha]